MTGRMLRNAQVSSKKHQMTEKPDLIDVVGSVYFVVLGVALLPMFAIRYISGHSGFYFQFAVILIAFAAGIYTIHAHHSKRR